jgi:hypothetical protein
MQYFYSLLFGLVNAFICAHFAKKRGRNALYWFIGGALFGLFALGTLFLLPIRKIIAQAKAETPMPLLQAAVPAQASKLWYYLDQEKQQYGPMSLDALGRAWNDGKLHVHSLVWNEDLESWKKLEEVMTNFQKK